MSHGSSRPRTSVPVCGSNSTGTAGETRMSERTTEPPEGVSCSGCRIARAMYDCIVCGTPICDGCAREGPGWRFVCYDCPIPDPRPDPWSPVGEEPGTAW